MDTRAKIKSWEAARLDVKEAQGQGRRVVFTNGCFDLVHAGHVRYLEEARSLGDVLIVGLNSDNSVRRLGKGPERPLTPQADRAEVLAALACVDGVVLFEEDTPLDLIEYLQPDILVKGADYTLEQIAGKDAVQSWGGEVRTVPLIPDRSTSRIIARILAGSERMSERMEE